ncbi:MAG TPA: hypothetical protein VFJ99_04825, partial [Solirubrobacterales bacterium]|nr:hypothetical protein [Solirubrobacterales bacterium]
MRAATPGANLINGRRALVGAVLSLLLVLAIPPAGARAASGPQMLDFHVAGGDGWRWVDNFGLEWANEPGPEPAAVLYRILDSSGTEIRPVRRRDGGAPLLGGVMVPSPGSYTIEAWLEGTGGEPGPHATATLRWDHVPPAS